MTENESDRPLRHNYHVIGFESALVDLWVNKIENDPLSA